MSTFEPIPAWDDVLRMARIGTYLWYQAPMDRFPSPVSVRKIFKNGKLRVYHGGQSWTCDRGHLDRFRARRVGP